MNMAQSKAWGSHLANSGSAKLALINVSLMPKYQHFYMQAAETVQGEGLIQIAGNVGAYPTKSAKPKRRTRCHYMCGTLVVCTNTHIQMHVRSVFAHALVPL